VISKAERNKTFRDGYGPLRCLAIDGWLRPVKLLAMIV